jgi:dCMP deaminase
MEERIHARPAWDDYFMAITMIVASRGNCDRLHTGAVLVRDKRIIATGYNGAPPGMPTCEEAGHLLEDGHCVRTIHGEHNAILQVARLSGSSTENTTLYTKYSPCIHCTKYIIGAGIKRVVIGKIYRNPQAIEMLKEAKIEVSIYKENPGWQTELVSMFSEGIAERTNEGKIDLSIEK